MKGLKIWALLGGFAVATSFTMAFAEDNKSGAQAPQYKEGVTAGSDRGIALDELFAAFKKNVLDDKPVAKSAPKVAVKTPTIAPTAHLTPTTKHHVVAKHSVTAKKNSNTPTTQTAHEQEPEQVEPNNSNDSSVMLAVSGASGNSSIISAKLDKPGALPKYKSGDRMMVRLTAKQDCNVLVFDYDSKGTLTQLYPNEYEPTGTMRAGTEIELGGTDSKYTLDVAGKGMERIFVYAYPTNDGPITVAMNPVPHTPFRSVELTPDQYRRLVRESKTFFVASANTDGSSDRSVKVTAKAGGPAVANASVSSEKHPNKLELVFQIDK
jgi:hypothetical protein